MVSHQFVMCTQLMLLNLPEPPLRTWYPGIPVLLVTSKFSSIGVPDPGNLKNLVPSPEFIPACADPEAEVDQLIAS